MYLRLRMRPFVVTGENCDTGTGQIHRDNHSQNRCDCLLNFKLLILLNRKMNSLSKYLLP